MLEIMVNGANGKMGQIVCELIEQNENLILKYKLDKESIINIDNIKDHPDVIIDFSVPNATLNILKYAYKNKIPVVIATTGFSPDEENVINEYSKNIPIFKSANMSYNITIMKNLVKRIAPLLKNTDIEIIETHHNKKIDSPSGTAQMFADEINNSLGNSCYYEYNRHSKCKKRDKNEIGISSVRGGNVVGEHAVQFFGEFETFELKHTAYSRKIFAEGAIKASQFLINKPNGMYCMEDFIKF